MKTTKIKNVAFIVRTTFLSASVALLCGCGDGQTTAKSTFISSTKTIELSDGVSLEMVNIPASRENDVRRSFWIGKYEVTQAQWETVMGENPSRFKNPDNPVEQVSWDDCQEFLKKLNELPSVKESGLTFRLPTEDEWELACRAGATGPYCKCKLADGTEITESTLGRVAWCGNDNYTGSTHPVGQKNPNAFGLYDMFGNVWEWTSTEWTSTTPAMNVECRLVFCGGGFLCPEWSCGSSKAEPSIRGEALGFRLCASGKAD